MATKSDILKAVKIVREFANYPDVGFVRETLDSLEASVTEVATDTVSVVESVTETTE